MLQTVLDKYSGARGGGLEARPTHSAEETSRNSGETWPLSLLPLSFVVKDNQQSIKMRDVHTQCVRYITSLTITLKQELPWLSQF